MLRCVVSLVLSTVISSGCRLVDRRNHSSQEPPKTTNATPHEDASSSEPPTGTDPGFALVGPPLQAVGPIHPLHGFPMWYADATGSRLEICIDADPKCVAPPADYDPTKPIEFPENFPGEAFYWMAEARIPLTTGGEFRILFALEAAFTTGVPIPGQRMTFERTLFVAVGARNGVYRITHPYGVNDVEVVGGRVRVVSDVGLAKERFDGVLNGPFGTLLRWDSGAPTGYIGDAALPHTFTGSPLGTNFFRIDTLQSGVLTTVGSAQLATISGRIAENKVVPSLSPNIFTTAPTLTLAPSEPGTHVFYTLDGSDPTSSTTRLPATADITFGPITIKPTQTTGTLDVMTVSELNGTYGKVSSYQYELNPNFITAYAYPSPGIYNAPVEVKLVSEGPATEIRYSTDDTDPLTSASAQIFNGTPIILSRNETHLVRFVALKRGATGTIEAQSKERKAYYTIAVEKLTRSTINPAFELPFSVKDIGGLNLAPCVDPTDAMCLPVAVGVPGGIDPNAPLVYPRNFPGETFIWSATARVTGTVGNAADVTLAIEGASPITGPAWGERVVFARLRIRADLTTAGHYRVTHPYGVKYFNVAAGATGKGSINYTDDVDPIPNNFDAFRFGHVGPFLRWGTNEPIGYIGDPNILHTVIGSPFGTNFVRVERFNGTQYETVLFTDQFTVSGKIAPDLDVDAGPMGGFYTAPQQITLVASDPAAQITYTTDGSNPSTSQTGFIYKSPIAVTQSTTINFFASLPTGLKSAVKSAKYTIDTTVPTITALPAGGGYRDNVTVTLTANRPSKIYYTLDSSTPLDSLSRSLYSSPIALSGPTQKNLRSVAIDQTGMASAVRSDSYSFTMTNPIVTPPVTLLAANTQIISGAVPTDTNWTAQTFGGRTISSFKLDRSVNSGTFTQVPLSTPTTTSQRFMLAPGANYEYRIGATDSGGLPSAVTRGGIFNLSVLQEAAGAISYRGTWLRTAATNFFGGTANSTTARNASATIRFTGTQVAWITAIGPTMGIATVTLDGVSQGSVDLYARANSGSVLKYVRTGLPRAVHTLVITATGTRNAASTGNRVDIDAVALIN